MNRFLHTSCCWGLAVLSSLLSLGNSAGLVLCIEDDGSMAIESPAEQAACRQRHELAAGLASSRPGDPATEIDAGDSTCCVDIPLTIAAASVVARPMSVRVVLSERCDFAMPRSASAAPVSPWELRLSQSRCSGRSPPSSTLMALETIVLLV